MVKSEKFDHLHLVYHFTLPLNKFIKQATLIQLFMTNTINWLKSKITYSNYHLKLLYELYYMSVNLRSMLANPKVY